MKTIAFIGLGMMGRPMAENLAKAGFKLQTYDARVRGTAGSIREAVSGADAVVTMLPNGGVVTDVVLEALPHLREGSVVIDMSSADPAGTRALGDALKAKGVEMLDAPVSGAVVGARNGTLAIMVGGEKKAFEESKPILASMGNQIFHVGPLGAGHAVKALNNYLGAVGTIAGFEALLVARAFGLDPGPMLEAINASTGRNSTTERKIPRDILTNTFGSGFKLALMAKDVGIAAELARGLKLNTPFLQNTLKTWKAAQKALPPDADHVEIYKWQEKLLKRRSSASSRKSAPSRGAASRRAAKRRTRRRST
ncbi:MAG TPA: NAD(P)-dependent oxidoreductase [Burkholderiales bacterium]|nr:NAD(P)-dependent oxidoreductase [Burkholderiales bacterium]